jgi:hypothetical protein
MAQRRNLYLIACLFAAIALVSMSGCSSTQEGGAEDPTDVPTDDGTGDGAGTMSADPEPEPEPEPEPAASGPGRIHIKVLASGQPASGHVRILTADVDPQIVDEGPASQTFDLSSGSYDVEVRMDETLDRPEKRLRDVRIPVGDTVEREVNFPVGTIKLQPRRGRGAIRSKVRWRYAGGGDWFEGTSNTGEDLTLSCGRYDAEITVNRTAIVISDVQVYEGRRSISPPIQMGGR